MIGPGGDKRAEHSHPLGQHLSTGSQRTFHTATTPLAYMRQCGPRNSLGRNNNCGMYLSSMISRSSRVDTKSYRRPSHFVFGLQDLGGYEAARFFYSSPACSLLGTISSNPVRGSQSRELCGRRMLRLLWGYSHATPKCAMADNTSVQARIWAALPCTHTTRRTPCP